MLARYLLPILLLAPAACVGGVKTAGGPNGGQGQGAGADGGDAGAGPGGDPGGGPGGDLANGGDPGGDPGGGVGEGATPGEGEGEGEGEGGGQVDEGVGEGDPPDEGAGEDEAEGQGEQGGEGGGEFVQPDVPASDEGGIFGGRCEALADCKSGICVAVGNFNLCSKFCTVRLDCPRTDAGDYSCTVTQMVDGRDARICLFTRNE